jgi:hypothetical protein
MIIKKWTRNVTILAAATIGMSCAGEKSKTKSNTGNYPDLAAMSLSLLPEFADASNALAITSTPTWDGATEFASSSMAREDVLSALDTGPNSRVRVQLKIASGVMNDINLNYYESETPKNCDATSLDDLSIPFFASNAHPIFWYDDGFADGEYDCFAAYDEGDNKIAVAFGTVEIADAPETCTDAKKYYVAYGYSTDTKTLAHQIQRFAYDGCTQEIVMATALATTPDTTVTDSSSQGFNARFEMAGNLGTGIVKIRVIKGDVYGDGADHNYHLLYASGQMPIGSATDGNMYVKQITSVGSCTPTTDGESVQGCVADSSTEVDFCLTSSATTQEFSLVASADADTACEGLDLPTSFPLNGALGIKAIEMDAAAFGL